MRFLRDQNLPVALCQVLADLGHEAMHIKPLGLADADDHAVWADAVLLGATIVTKDSDFVALAGERCRVVRLRIGNRSNAALYAIVRTAWPSVVARLQQGQVLIDVHG